MISICQRFLAMSIFFATIPNLGFLHAQLDSQESQIDQILAEIDSKHIEERLTGIEKADVLKHESGKPILSPRILDALILAISDREPDVQAAATRALGRFGPEAGKAIPALIAHMKGTDQASDDVFLWLDCSRTLTAIGPEAIPHLIEALDNKNDNTYKGACQSLHNLAPTLSDMLAEPVVNEMIARIEKESGKRRWCAVFVIKNFGPKAKTAVAALTSALSDGDFQIHIMSCQALAAIGKPSQPAAKRLHELMKHGNVSERSHAALALGAIGVIDGFDNVQSLSRMLKDSSQVVRERAMVALGSMGRAAISALPEIESALTGREFATKPVAAVTYWKVSGEKDLALETLLPLIDDKTHELGAIKSLGEMGADAESAVSALIRRSETEDVSILIEVSIALSSIGKGSPEVIDLLDRLAESEDKELQRYASQALKKLKK